jgi:hypothetical protein
MNVQVYGIFDSIENAERTISALKDHGVEDSEVSVVRRSDGSGIPQLENAADHGITVTGPADVTAGAMKGGAVGLALGILASAVALTIPGIGPILAAGPIAAAIGSTAGRDSRRDRRRRRCRVPRGPGGSGGGGGPLQRPSRAG